MSSHFPPRWDTLREARGDLNVRMMKGEAVTCPCCDQLAKLYRRKINSTMARAIITMFRAGPSEGYLHVPSLPGDTHEISQLSWWGLIEEKPGRRDDEGRHGWWRLTKEGVEYVLMRHAVRKYALVYDHVVRGFEGEYVNIRDALGTRFNYHDLMEGL